MDAIEILAATDALLTEDGWVFPTVEKKEMYETWLTEQRNKK